jgi:signal transduction histidine kinase/ligand-binding sensor domain-containing protein/DNA-binding response OmpR family regulator
MSVVTIRRVRLLAIALLSVPAWGLDPRLALTQLGHDVWTTSNGLANDSVRAIVQTADGYLWFATVGGLARFDGMNFTVFNGSDTPLLKGSTLTAILAAPDGSLWIGTGNNGLVRYRNGGFEKIVAPGLPGGTIRALLVDSQGVFWIGADGGLARLDKGRATSVFTGNWEANVHDLVEQPAGTVWVGANNGLHRFEGGVERIFTTRDGLPDNSVQGLAAGAGGALWIGTHGGGLIEYRRGRFRAYGRRDGFTPTGILALLSDRHGALWIATDGAGLIRFAGGKFTSYQTRDGLSNQVIRCLYEDHEGSVWMGTAGGGVNRFKEYRVAIRTMREGLPSDSVRSVQQDASGDVWLGTANGIARIRASGSVAVYGPKDGLSRDAMWPVIRDRRNNLWAGSEEGILQRFRGEPQGRAQRQWKLKPPIRTLFEQRDGTVWAGSGDSLIRFQGDSMAVFGKEQGLASVPVTAMAEDAGGAVWVGTARGVQRLDHGQFGPVLARPGKRQTVYTMHADAAGSLWAMTNSGLNRIAGTHLTAFTPAQGMPDLDLAWIFEDDAGYFWMAGRDGMLRVSRADLDAVAEGRKRAVQPRRFGVADWMRGSSEFALGMSPTAWQGPGNKLYFATYGGLLEIDPARLMVARPAPPVLIERVTDNRRKPVAAGGWVRAGDNLEFQYTALTFLFPEFTQFRFKLEGFDADWVEAGNRRAAYYTNLPPGTYRFRVVARNTDSAWNEKGASFSLEARPRFYRTFWFAALCVLAICTAGVGYYQTRVRELRRSERKLAERVQERTAELLWEVEIRQRAEEAAYAAEKTAQAANRAKSEFLANMSHEIRTPLNGVLGVTELLMDTETVPERRAYLGLVRNSGENLLRIINEILDFSKIEAGKLELDLVDFDLQALLDQTMKSFGLNAGQKGIELICQVEDVPDMVVGDPTRLRQVLTNLVGNALKFTLNGEIVVHAQLASQDASAMVAHFSIRDTGIGISAEQQRRIFEPFAQADSATTRKYGGTGLGLTVCLRLVEMMGGRVWVVSELGHGSCFHFTARLGVSEKQRGTRPVARNLKDVAVLIVDDNATNLLLLQEMLAHWGMTVRAEAGAKAAFAFAQAAADAGSPLSLVITDAHMPEEDGFDLARRLRQSPQCAGAAIIMLTSASQSGDPVRCRELGLAAHITKPVSSWELRQLICGVLNGTAEESAMTEPFADGLPGEERPGASRKILLAEDNPVNQIVAVRLLERRGHEVTVAANGREAVAAVARESFDLVLMDVQMPEMDGFEATAIIRKAETGTARRLPIFALTARAMKGDADHCRAAGMDGYLAKPINSADLYAIVDGCSPAPCAPRLYIT